MGRLLICLLMLASPARHRKPVPNPRDIRKHGCILQQRSGDPRWYAWAWALLPGDETDCSHELQERMRDGRPFPTECYVEQLSARESRNKAYQDCSSWLDDLDREIRESQRKSSK